MGRRKSLSLEVESVAGGVVVRLAGSAGMNDAEALQARLCELVTSQTGPVVLDLEELDFISSQGLGALIAVQVDHRRHRGPLRLVNPQPAIRDILNVTRLTQIFPLYDSATDALEELPG